MKTIKLEIFHRCLIHLKETPPTKLAVPLFPIPGVPLFHSKHNFWKCSNICPEGNVVKREWYSPFASGSPASVTVRAMVKVRGMFVRNPNICPKFRARDLWLSDKDLDQNCEQSPLKGWFEGEIYARCGIILVVHVLLCSKYFGHEIRGLSWPLCESLRPRVSSTDRRAARSIVLSALRLRQRRSTPPPTATAARWRTPSPGWMRLE